MSAAEKLQEHPVFKQAKSKAEYYYSQLDKELTKYPVLINLEQRTQAALLSSPSCTSSTPLAAPVSNLVGWALPAYLSFKAVESPSPHDDVQWLTYWVVFGFFNFLESFALRVVLYYVPWYFAFKTLFIVWLQLPYFRGAQVTYVNILKPVLNNISSSGVVAKADTLRERTAEATE
ncbi:TB2/DP1, HVA22 family-domain-containing protein [Armillaria borealis]|uniref:Protein YOP1 n=1 Tax=Armillaria borealis TaxID=47425 RepID=A0AA39N3M3_9AGAR|nr:TB2/DP1, HVA22 family-domain-containing protein [Armillaria borealis]